MPKSMDENLEDILKDFNLSKSRVAEGFNFFAESSMNADLANLFVDKVIPEVFKDCLPYPERPNRESLLALSASYQGMHIKRRLPDELLPLLACAVMVTAILETPGAKAKDFVTAAKKLTPIPHDSENLIERFAEQVCELKAQKYTGVPGDIPVPPIKLKGGIPFEDLRRQILNLLSPEFRLALEVAYKRQKDPNPEREKLLLQYAADRSHRDYLAASEGTRLSANILILINGGAATAVLAYLANLVAKGQGGLSPWLLKLACGSLFLYALGVACGTLSIKYVAEAANSFGHSWRRYLEGEIDFHEIFAKEGTINSLWYNGYFVASLILFIVSGIVLAVAFAFFSQSTAN